MPTCYQLIGIPASGKSTWAATQEWAADCVTISTDNHVEEYAKSLGKTYNEVFHEYMPTATDLMAQDVIAARNQNKDIIWDQTSTTVKSRKRKFRMLPGYRHIAVVFKIPDTEELEKRLSSRPGKTIPAQVIKDMINQFTMPDEEEGFSEIWFAS